MNLKKTLALQSLVETKPWGGRETFCAELSRRAAVPLPTIERIWNGEIGFDGIPFGLAIKIAQCLDIGLDLLAGIEDIDISPRVLDNPNQTSLRNISLPGQRYQLGVTGQVLDILDLDIAPNSLFSFPVDGKIAGELPDGIFRGDLMFCCEPDDKPGIYVTREPYRLMLIESINDFRLIDPAFQPKLEGRGVMVIRSLSQGC